MKFRIGAVGLVLLLAIAGCGGGGGSDNDNDNSNPSDGGTTQKSTLTGTWGNGTSDLTLTTDGTYSVDTNSDGVADAWGNYSATTNQIDIIDSGGANACYDVIASEFIVGAYAYIIDQDQLTLTLINDDCSGRASTMNDLWEDEGSAADSSVPSTPGSFNALAVSESQINLTWNVSSDNVGVAGYKIYEGSTLLGVINQTAYAVIGLETDSNHCYHISAFDAAGNVSDPTSTLCAQVQSLADVAPPSNVTGFTAQAVSTSQINLDWTDSTDDVGVAGYNIYRDNVLFLSTISGPFSDTGLAEGTYYCYSVEAYDATGNISVLDTQACATTLISVDTTSPSTPSDLSANSVSSSQIILSWTASTDDRGVVDYKVYRDGTLRATVTSTTFSDSGLIEATPYCYTVVANDSAGNESTESIESCTTTDSLPDTTAPTIPEGVVTEAVSTEQINVSWSVSTDNVAVAGYKIYRDGTLLGTSVGTVFADTGLDEATEYCYVISAYDISENESAVLDEVCAFTTSAADITSPSVPTNLSAETVSTSQVNLIWTASTDDSDIADYNIYRDGTLRGSSVSPLFTDTGLTEGTEYCYTVAAQDAAGNVSAQSGQVCAQTDSASAGASIDDFIGVWSADADVTIGSEVFSNSISITFSENEGTLIAQIPLGLENGIQRTDTWTGVVTNGVYQFTSSTNSIDSDCSNFGYTGTATLNPDTSTMTYSGTGDFCSPTVGTMTGNAVQTGTSGGSNTSLASFAGAWSGLWLGAETTLTLNSSGQGSLVVQMNNINHHTITESSVVNDSLHFDLPLSIEDQADQSGDCANWNYSCDMSLVDANTANVSCSGIVCSSTGGEYNASEIALTRPLENNDTPSSFLVGGIWNEYRSLDSGGPNAGTLDSCYQFNDDGTGYWQYVHSEGTPYAGPVQWELDGNILTFDLGHVVVTLTDTSQLNRFTVFLNWNGEDTAIRPWIRKDSCDLGSSL